MGIKSHDSGTVACLARATAAELRRRYPTHTAKNVARDLHCGLKLAESILGGHLSAPTVARLIGAYGPGWVAERVLEAAGLTLSDYVEQQAAEAEQAAARAQDRAREARELHETLQAARSRHSGDAGARP